MENARSVERQELLAMFGLSEADVADMDLDGYIEARAAAEAQRTEFERYVRGLLQARFDAAFDRG